MKASSVKGYVDSTDGEQKGSGIETQCQQLLLDKKNSVLLDVRFYFPFTFLLQFCIIITICWPMVCAVYTLLLCFLFFGIYVFFGGFCTLLFFHISFMEVFAFL